MKMIHVSKTYMYSEPIMVLNKLFLKEDSMFDRETVSNPFDLSLSQRIANDDPTSIFVDLSESFNKMRDFDEDHKLKTFFNNDGRLLDNPINLFHKFTIIRNNLVDCRTKDGSQRVMETWNVKGSDSFRG
eukprot:GHVR01079713.1.p1 GENE.GHVR01079713.1~~GHVR01079713.1.p1  ORF type:complete len:130 (+),score=6.05 GHVR01079713.1:639-1028(+)